MKLKQQLHVHMFQEQVHTTHNFQTKARTPLEWHRSLETVSLYRYWNI